MYISFHFECSLFLFNILVRDLQQTWDEDQAAEAKANKGEEEKKEKKEGEEESTEDQEKNENDEREEGAEGDEEVSRVEVHKFI